MSSRDSIYQEQIFALFLYSNSDMFRFSAAADLAESTAPWSEALEVTMPTVCQMGLPVAYRVMHQKYCCPACRPTRCSSRLSPIEPARSPWLSSATAMTLRVSKLLA